VIKSGEKIPLVITGVAEKNPEAGIPISFRRLAYTFVPKRVGISPDSLIERVAELEKRQEGKENYSIGRIEGIDMLLIETPAVDFFIPPDSLLFSEVVGVVAENFGVLPVIAEFEGSGKSLIIAVNLPPELVKVLRTAHALMIGEGWLEE